jgi:hypothetical protein
MLQLFLILSFFMSGPWTTTPAAARGRMPVPNLAIFSRSIYPGDDATFDTLRNSGFTTVILSSFYIHDNGDVYSGDSHSPIIHNGQYIGDPAWLKRVASLKKRPGAVTRIEILLEGRWYNQPPNTYDFIRDWSDPAAAVPGIVTGTDANSTLYALSKVFKDAIGVDAVCIDDESVYNSVSIVRYGAMLKKLGMHMTLCPFAKPEYWAAIMSGSEKGLIDGSYLQCYDGGTKNTPGPWVKALGDALPVYPIFLCRGSFSTCGTSHNSKTTAEIGAEMQRFKTGYPGMSGAAIWQMADIKGYVRMNCAVKDPSSGDAVSAGQFLNELKTSLGAGL